MQCVDSLQDHPRTRGKHYPTACPIFTDIGSPPHTREALDSLRKGTDQIGITPAHAGSTVVYINHDSRTRDHPRTRGKHVIRSRSMAVVMGSPPHTREALEQTVDRLSTRGITPAHAGSTGSQGRGRHCVGDHPRTRGKHMATEISARFDPGSPPHTREAHMFSGCSKLKTRITPAHAGSTLMVPLWMLAFWDHPRTRGKH